MEGDEGAPGAGASPPAPDDPPPAPRGWRARLADASFGGLVGVASLVVGIVAAVLTYLQLRVTDDDPPPDSTSPRGELTIAAVDYDRTAGTIAVSGSVEVGTVERVYARAQIRGRPAEKIAGADVADGGSWNVVIVMGPDAADDACCRVTAGLFLEPALPSTSEMTTTTEDEDPTTTQDSSTTNLPSTSSPPTTGPADGGGLDEDDPLERCLAEEGSRCADFDVEVEWDG